MVNSRMHGVVVGATIEGGWVSAEESAEFVVQFSEVVPRCIELIQVGSGIICEVLPSEADFKGPVTCRIEDIYAHMSGHHRGVKRVFSDWRTR